MQYRCARGWRRRWQIVGALLFALWSGLTPGAALGYDLILDKSGSMAGYARAGEMWRDFIAGLEGPAERRYAFGNDMVRLPAGASLLSVPLRDAETRLDAAMTRWLADTDVGASAVIVTDNVVDYQNADSTAAQHRFYGYFTAPDAPVTHLAVVLLRLPFDGRVYPLTGSGWQQFKGDRALVLYVLSRGDGAGFEALLTLVDTVLGGLGLSHHKVRVKPFDRTALHVRGPGRDYPIQTPAHLKDKLRLQDGIIWMRGLAVGDDLQFPLEVVISSDSAFVLRDVQADAHISFRDTRGMIHPDGFRITVDPPRADVTPGRDRTFRLLVEGGGFLLPGEVNPLDRALLTLRNAEPVEGDLWVRFTANLRNLDLSEGLLAEWNHERPEALGDGSAADAQARVYMLAPLILDLLPGDVERVEELLSEHLGVRIDLRYPVAPLVAALFLLAVAVIGLWFLLRWLTRRREFLLIDEYGGEQRFAPSLFSGRRVYAGDQGQGAPVFLLHYLLLGFLVFAGKAYRLRTGRWLGGGRGVIRLQRRDGDEYDLSVWDLRPARTSARQSGPGPGSWQDDGWDT